MDNPTPVVAVTDITLDPTLVMKVGDVKTLTVTVSPDNATDKTVTWISTNTAVATVAGGVVTAVGAGTAKITATAKDGSGVEVTCTITVLPEVALTGQFSVSDTKKVWFSKGNLQATYDGSTWTWAFATNQWDYIGDAAGNTSIDGNGTVSASNVTIDLFGWVGASNTTWTGAAQYGISNSTGTYTTDTYGNSTSDALKSDWGTNMGTDWRTLTSDEWTYLFSTRTASTVNGETNARYAKAKLFDTTYGVIVFPDSYTHPDGVAAPTGINKTDNTSWDANKYSAADWKKMEEAGAVFLPAAGCRGASTVYNADTDGRYWSSSSSGSLETYAYNVYFISGNLKPAEGNLRECGCSVRLVYVAE